MITSKVVSWDEHTFSESDYTAVLATSTGLPTLEPQYAERYQETAVITGVKFTQYQLSPLQIVIENEANADALRLNLHQWFDNKDAVPRRLVVEDIGGGNQRYVEGICLSLVQVASLGGLSYTAIVALDGVYDPAYRFRAVTPSTDSWNITATGATNVVNNGGQDEAYPILRVTPTASKSTNGYAYRRWVPIVWKTSQGAKNYPIDITNGGFDTASLISGSKLQADGDDLRIEVNGVETSYYVAGLNTSATKIWTALSYTGKRSATLQEQMLSASTVTQITCSSSIAAFPSSGILLIEAEAFVYTGKIDSTQTFIGVTRAERNTTAATHDAGTIIYLVENDIWLKYGNPGATAFVQDPNVKPVIDLSESTNTTWKYYYFGELDKSVPGAWSHTLSNDEWWYTSDNHSVGYESPYPVYGLYRGYLDTAAEGRVFKSNPCGIEVFTASGETMRKQTSTYPNQKFVGGVDSTGSAIEETEITNSASNTWESWTATLVLGYTDVYEVYLEMRPDPGGITVGESLVDIDEATLSLNSSYTPISSIGAEVSNYTLSATVTNELTGDYIVVNFSMAPNQTLKIDTDKKTTVYLKDNSSQFGSVSRPIITKKQWLPLLPGNNTLRFDDVGTQGVTIAIEFEERSYY
jgi:hypothetical protein